MNYLIVPLTLLMSAFSYCQNLYDIDNVTLIEIEFEEDNWDAILDTYYASELGERLVGTVSVNGQMYDSVGVRYKGNSTYNASNGKNPMNIKLDTILSQKFQGYETLKLSNGDKDPSFVREVLSYEIGRKYMDMPLSNYAKVYVNGDYYGLFSSSEAINGDYLERRFYADSDNARIKCNPESVFGGVSPSLEYLGTDSASYYEGYELKSDFGWDDLISLCDVLNNDLTNIEDVLDVDRALWMLAFNNVLVNLDSYTGPFRQNYYLLEDDNGRLCPVIWDLNQSLASFAMVDEPGGGGGGPPSITDLTDMDPYLREGDADFPLIAQLFSNDRYRKMYMAHYRTIFEENFEDGSYYTRAEELQDIIADEVSADPNAFYSLSQFTSNLDNTEGGTGPSGVYGISEVMDDRVDYLSSHPAFSMIQPTITAISNDPALVTAFSVVTLTAEIEDANYAYLGWRDYGGDVFQKEELFDDGLHGDGAAGDGLWGASITVAAADIQYYIYAENADAGKFSPVRAEHEFHHLTITSDVVINEFAAKNGNLFFDESGDDADWVELYNNTAAAIDLSGYYLSDEIGDNMKWEFPAGTSIGANNYLIIWCDKDTMDEGLHANFKISSSGDTVVLSSSDGTILSEVVQPKMESMTTFGRYPNGTGDFIRMIPTFSAENSYTTIGIEEEVLSDEFQMQVYPNPTTDFLRISTDYSEEVEIEIYDLRGQVVFQKRMIAHVEVDTKDWKSGVYIARIPSLGLCQKVVRL